jgi:dihydroxy-acid dehydratase
MVRISDARMSGTAFGTIVVHIAPEAAADGPLALVDDGDLIRLDVPARRIDLLVEEKEIQARGAKRRARTLRAARGYVKLYCDHVLQADEGCDFDFFRPVPPRS